MDLRQLVKTITGPTPVISVCAILLFSLSYLIYRSLSFDAPGELQFWTVLLGSIGIAILLFFLVANCYSLYRQYARDELGSKLTMKMVTLFLLLTVIPFSLIYYFSIQFLNKGVNSWFDVKIEQTVQDAVFLSQSSLDSVLEEITQDVKNYANSLRADLETGSLNKLLRDIELARELEGYAEFSLYTDDGRIVVFSNADKSTILPDTPPNEVFTELQIGQTFSALEQISDNTQQFRVVTPISLGGPSSKQYALQAIKFLPLSYANLASSVNQAANNYDQMVFSRGPLRFSLIVTLSLISLASLLFSILTAMYLSRRLVAPISHLAAGTKMIADGNYGQHIPVTSSDELGILTNSFNNMSSKIEEAQRNAKLSQQETEQQKGYLEAVLTNLSSGVFSFNQNQELEICNSAALDILNLSQPAILGKALSEITEQHSHLSAFMQAISQGLNSGKHDWQDEVTILGAHGRQILIMRGTLIDSDHNKQSTDKQNYVVVFDDVTNLIQAQRDAAWGEVARRLAHEIKNPLTPIQLSAERIRNKFYSEVADDQKETLDRSTRTIVQQVESMKEMVNAFSSYAQPVRASLSSMDINQLIADVVELHASSLSDIEVKLKLDQHLPEIKANSSALRQVLNNLIINACHALEETDNPELTIVSESSKNVTGNYIDIIVADSGHGIPADIRESLFDPYVSSKTKGSGLGLAIVKRIVEEHGGSVIANDAQTGGTEMLVRLPVNALQTYRGNRVQNTLHSVLK